jgi:outer membrane protein TolC
VLAGQPTGALGSNCAGLKHWLVFRVQGFWNWTCLRVGFVGLSVGQRSVFYFRQKVLHFFRGAPASNGRIQLKDKELSFRPKRKFNQVFEAGKGNRTSAGLGCVLLLMGLATPLARGQASGVSTPPPPLQVIQPQINSTTYKGSVALKTVKPGVLGLSLEDAIQMGLQHNLGLLLTSQTTQSARGAQLDKLQALLPTVNGKITEAEQESDLQAEGLRIPGFPTIIGPYGYTDIRGSLSWSLLDLSSLQNYLASKHDFDSAKLSVQDAWQMVVLTVGNAYLRVIADKAQIAADKAQLATSKVSLQQAQDRHSAGTAPKLDVLRAQVDYQTQQQALISDQNAYQKDKIALARAIGLPLAQKYVVTEKVPFAPLEKIDRAQAVQDALASRMDLKALEQKVQASQHARRAATFERLPVVKFKGDYGDIGINVRKSHGTGNAVGSLDVPIFEEPKLRGDAKQAQSQLDEENAKLGDLRGQITQDVDDSILDIESSEKQVQVAKSNVALATEELKEAQERYKAGVSDNLEVSQAQQALARADAQYVSSLYAHNVAKLSLARAMGIAGRNYKTYLGGK